MWGQWQGSATVQWNEQDIFGVCTLSIDEDQQYMGVVSFSSHHHGEFAPRTAALTVAIRRMSVDQTTGVQDWKSESTTLFDESFSMSRPGKEESVGELRFQLRPGEPPIAGVHALIIEVRNSAGKAIGSGKIFDPGVDHPDLRLSATPITWPEFREWALKNSRENPGVLYRGHTSNRKRLTTTFHRQGRRNLLRYGIETMSSLARDYENFGGERMNLQDSHDFSRLLALARHHGYPTPVLDWTLSPFVAAYFAFREVLPEDEDDVSIRLFCLDPGRIGMRRRPVIVIDPRPCIQSMPLPERGNPRGTAQQSRYLFTTVANVEALITRIQEEPANEVVTGEGVRMAQNVQVFDVPRAARREVINDLRLMGVTGASLFPGIQGFFDAARERDF